MVTSDDLGSYAREEVEEKHLTGKIFTQRLERNNLPLRTRIRRPARKTICFPRSVEIHEKIIGSFIEKHMFCWLEALSNYETMEEFRSYIFDNIEIFYNANHRPDSGEKIPPTKNEN